MKKSTSLFLILAAGVAGALVPPQMLCAATQAPAAGTGAQADKTGGTGLKAADWADPGALKSKLAKDILRRLKGTSEAELRTFLAVPANRLKLVQWHVANCASGDALRRLVESPGPGAPAMVQRVTNDLGWMEQIAYTGECADTGRVLAMLAALDERHPGFADERVTRDIATATALEWARSGWDSERALERAGFYIRHHREGRFHKGFKSLPFWQYRVIGGSKGNNANGSLESLEWALDNVHLPITEYPGACWQASYLSTNLFGDSIHGDYYYSPYNDVYGSNAIQRSREVGGVCGSLSHFGAFAALANGVPAMTAGEPGHCAYIVCVNGTWTPSYSLSWQRGLHWSSWNGNDKYSSLHMASALYAPGQEQANTLSNAYRSLAELHTAQGNFRQAHDCFHAAAEAQPLNYLAWAHYAKLLSAHFPDNAQAWQRLYKTLSHSLAPQFPEMAAELLLGHVHAGMHRACPTHRQRMECYHAFWMSLRGMGPDRWAVEKLCDSQAGSLQDTQHNREEAALAFYQMALRHTGGNAAYAPVLISWGNGAAAKMGDTMQRRFLKATLTGLSQGEGMDATARDNILGQALAGAERMRDRSSFQAVGKLLSDKHRQPRLPWWEPFPGKLVSQGGMMYASSSAHDDPAEHWGVLEPTGGRFHTASQENPWVVVELPRMAYLTGIVAVSTAGWNNRRIRDMRVEYSESGRDNDWHTAGAFAAPSTRDVNRLDLQDSKPRARYIRIIRGGAPDVFHLNGIFVYGEQAS